MSSKVEIYNMALDLAGGRGTVSDATENSREATLCSRHYDQVRKNVLKSAPWPCAKAWERLSVLAQRDDQVDWASGMPAPGWAYAYARPASCLLPRFLHSYQRFEQGVHNGTTLAIMANEPDAILAYVRDVTESGLWDADLERAIIYQLAAMVTYALAAKEGRWDRLHLQAQVLVADARTAAANSEDLPSDTVPDWISSRGYDSPARLTRFIQPYETLNTVLA